MPSTSTRGTGPPTRSTRSGVSATPSSRWKCCTTAVENASRSDGLAEKPPSTTAMRNVAASGPSPSVSAADSARVRVTSSDTAPAWEPA
ncbi:hypothetical protein COSO111634_37350 [Corallococcus soli]